MRGHAITEVAAVASGKVLLWKKIRAPVARAGSFVIEPATILNIGAGTLISVMQGVRLDVRT